MTASTAARLARKKIIEKIDGLISQARDNSTTRPAQAIEWLEEALLLAQTHRYQKVFGEIYQIHSHALWKLGELGKAMEYATYSLKLHQDRRNQSGIATALFCCGSIAGMKGDTEQAIEYFKAALQTYQALADKKHEASILDNIGGIYFQRSEYIQALECFQQSLSLQDSLGKEQAHQTLGNLALVYQRLGDYSKSLEYFQKIIAICRCRHDKEDEANTFCNIGHLYLEQADYEAAREVYQQALSIAEQGGFKNKICEASHGLGIVYSLTGDFERAEQDLRLSLDLSYQTESANWQMKNNMALGKLFASPSPKKSTEIAIDFFQQALEIAFRKSDKKAAAECYAALSTAFKESGDLEKALRHHEEFYRLDKELFNDNSNRRQRDLMRQLEESQTKRENDRLKSEMEHREKELTMVAAMLIEKNQLVDSLKAEISILAKENKGEPCYLNMIQRIDSTRDKNAVWKTFEKQFDLLHHGFLQTLAVRFPKLTPTECKICALMKINLSTKEISNLLFISTRSVESYRLQVRKKLSLPPAQNLSTFLAAL